MAMNLALLPGVGFVVMAAASCGGGNSVSGDTTVDFTPTFFGSATVDGTCPCPSIGGPASYHAVVVLMSDDPSFSSQCSAKAEEIQFDFGSFHYLTIQVVSTAPIAPGTFTIENPTPKGAFATVLEDRPVPSGKTSVDFVQDDDATGTVEIDQLGTVVSGSFNAVGFHDFGGMTVDGNLSGSFQASACQAPASGGFQSPCSACPG
jgi:hypothetical protein